MTIVSMAACSGCGVGVSTNGLLIPVTPGGGAAPIMILGAGTCSTIRCGVSNQAAGCYSAALGGKSNAADDPYSIVAGGKNNLVIVGSPCSTIVGGQSNTAYLSVLSFIGGGSGNTNYNYSQLSVIGGGSCNRIAGVGATNQCSFCSVIAGGSSNVICCSKDSFIGGGGGNLNTQASSGSVIGGGVLNCNTTSVASTIGGGIGNAHNVVNFGFIGGGYKNVSSADLTVIGGGSYNIIAQYNGVIGGGYYNRVCGINSSILGGTGNLVPAAYPNSHIIGSNITANAANTTFVENLTATGIIKYTGTFRIPHPDPIKTKTHTLNHSFVESPNAGDNIYRFSVSVKDGKAEIELPSYFKFLNCDVQVFVTPKNGFGIGYGIINEELDKVSIYTNLDIEYNVLIIGTRKDSHAVKSWKGTERVKSDGEIKAYKDRLKNDVES
jgi:hypothetical protein